MNAIRSIAVIFLLAALWSPAQGEENQDLATTVKFYATEIKKEVNLERWNVQESPTTIVIESKFKAEIKQIVSPAIGAEPRFETYRIELRFQTMLAKDEYIKLAKERVEHAALVNYGTKTKEEWGNAQKFLKDHPLPRYDVQDRVGKHYSVYLFTSDTASTTVVPTTTYVEVKSIEAILDHIMWPDAQ